MYRIAQPFRKIWVIYTALLLGVFVVHEFFEFVVIQVSISSKIFQDVFDSDKSIKIRIQRQECLSD